MVKNYGTIYQNRNNSATITTADWVYTLPESFYPVDYANDQYPVIFKK